MQVIKDYLLLFMERYIRLNKLYPNLPDISIVVEAEKDLLARLFVVRQIIHVAHAEFHPTISISKLLEQWDGSLEILVEEVEKMTIHMNTHLDSHKELLSIMFEHL